MLSGGVPVLVNSLRYLVEGALPRANPFSSSSSSSRRSSSDYSSRDGEDIFARGGGGGRKRRRKSGKGSRAKVVEDLSLFYALATLTNLCESPVYRTMIVGVGGFDVVTHLVDIVDSPTATSNDAIKQVFISRVIENSPCR